MFNLPGDNITLNNAGVIDPALLGAVSVLSGRALIGNGGASTVNVTSSATGTMNGTASLLGLYLLTLQGMALNVNNGAGGSAAALNGGGGSLDSTFGTLGLRASTALGETTRLRGLLGWRHAFGDRTPNSTAAFATGPSFSAASAPLARNVAVIEAGVETQLQHNMTLSASYAGQVGSGIWDNGFRIALGWKF